MTVILSNFDIRLPIIFYILYILISKNYLYHHNSIWYNLLEYITFLVLSVKPLLLYGRPASVFPGNSGAFPSSLLTAGGGDFCLETQKRPE